MKVKKTERGFSIAKFKDQKKQECCIQKSSTAGLDCIWLGMVGTDRMHLSQKQVKKLIPLLQKFVDTGDL